MQTRQGYQYTDPIIKLSLFQIIGDDRLVIHKNDGTSQRQSNRTSEEQINHWEYDRLDLRQADGRRREGKLNVEADNPAIICLLSN